jgi:hypothetical protein
MRCRVACADALDAALAPICSECTEPGSLPENVVRMERAFICPTPTCDNYALAVAPSSQATPPLRCYMGDCEGADVRRDEYGVPVCADHRKSWAAPFSSPAPSGQKKDDERH